MKLRVPPLRRASFDVVKLLEAAALLATLSTTCYSQAVDVHHKDVECPIGSVCVLPLRCTMMMDPADLPLESNSTVHEHTYQRCWIGAKFGEGICCRTSESGRINSDAYNDYADSENVQQDGGAGSGDGIYGHQSPPSDVDGQSEEQYLRFLLDASNDAGQGHKIHKRAISNYDERFRGDQEQFPDALKPLTRTKRCVVGPPCEDKGLRYRTYNGRCNNVHSGRSLWGSTGYPMERVLPPAYTNTIWAPRTVSVTGRYLPNARKISATLFTDLHVPHEKYNVLFMQFGQFLVHDITKNKVFTTNANCCVNNGKAMHPNPHPACFAIPVAFDDPFYSQYGVKCMEFVRTAIASRSECPIGHGRQISAVSHFIDASGIYGNSEQEVNKLRSHEGGRLKSIKHRQHNNELPPLESDPEACEKKAEMCFKVGDDRVNQIIGLVGLHTVFLREHNRVAQALEKINPHWKDEVIFKETRRIVGAQIQHIVYNEYLPKIVGPHFMEKYDLYTSRGYSNFYNPDVNPSITSEFAAAAFRFGHSTVPSQLELPSGILPTHKTFFNPSGMRDPQYMDQMFRGILLQPMQNVDNLFSYSLTRFLNPKEDHPYGRDLVATNIQRGRDHALKPYNHYVHLAGMPVKKDFRDFGPVLGPKLAELYASPEDVDLFIGGMVEPHVPGGIVGETFANIISDQFARLKEGDRYFYSNGPHSNPGHFTLPQLEQLQKISLAGVLCANANNYQHFEVQPDTFALPHPMGNPLLHCRSERIPKLDLTWWKD